GRRRRGLPGRGVGLAGLRARLTGLRGLPAACRAEAGRRGCAATAATTRRRVDAPAHALEDLAEGLLHVAHLVQLVVAPLPVEAQDRDAPLVLHLGIDLAIGLLVRDHLAAARQADAGAVLVADRLLHRQAVALGAIDHP